MRHTALDSFAGTVGDAWAPISSGLVCTCRDALAELTRADIAEPWLASLLNEMPAGRELVRNAQHGFMLLAHTENEGLFRPPHDHGRGWVVYAVQSGALEIRTYGKVLAQGKSELVLRDETILEAGSARAYLPGDIHDTRCLSSTALLFRFTERDLRYEDQVERKVTRFVDADGVWVAPPLSS
jgi:hypothetical protein